MECILVIAHNAHDYKNSVPRICVSKNGQNVLGVRRSWRAGADCKSVVLRLRWFESTHSHQNKKHPLTGCFCFVLWEWVDPPEYQRHNTCRLKTTVFVGASQQDMHGEYENTQLEKS